MLIGAGDKLQPLQYIMDIIVMDTLYPRDPTKSTSGSRRNPPPPSIPIMLLTNREKL
jgi:hypothetical protein